MKKRRTPLKVAGAALLLIAAAFTAGSAANHMNSTDEKPAKEEIVTEGELTKQQKEAEAHALVGFDSTSQVLIRQLSEQFPETIENEAQVSIDGGITELEDGTEMAVRSLTISSIPKDFKNTESLNFFLDRMQKLKGSWKANELDKTALQASLNGNQTVNDAVEVYDESENPELPVMFNFVYSTDNDSGLKSIYFTSSAVVQGE